MRLPATLALTLAVGLTAAAQDNKDARAARYAELKKQFAEDDERMGARFTNAKTEADQQKVRDETKKMYAWFAGKMLKLAEENPKDDTAAAALRFAALRHAEFTTTGPDVDRAAELLVTHHAASEKTRELVNAMKESGENGLAFLKVAAEKAATPEIKGVALLGVGTTLAEQAGDADDPKAAADLTAQAERYLERAAAEAGDVKVDDGTVKQAATAELTALRTLGVGKPAPEAEGTTLDGKKVKLSDYKGKVVLLDFWATWCGPCRRMIPHEREMVKKLEGKPFALVSVSADEKKADLTGFLEQQKMPWTHWWDGAEAAAFKTYRVRAFPTLYLIDAKGVIRKKWVGAPDNEGLDKAVEGLVREAGGK